MTEKKVEKKESECVHENCSPIAFFPEQYGLNLAVLVLNCEDCGETIMAYGDSFA